MAYTQVLKDIAAERARQQKDEGHTLEDDIAHNKPGQFALAAAAYAAQTGTLLQLGDDAVAGTAPPSLWPFTAESYKPTDRRQSLVKAAALLAAEIERFDHDHKS